MLHVCSEDWHGIKSLKDGSLAELNATEVQGNALGKQHFSKLCCSGFVSVGLRIGSNYENN